MLMTLSTNGKFTSTKQSNEQKWLVIILFSPQSNLVILYASGMYGMSASAHNDSQMLLRSPWVKNEHFTVVCHMDSEYWLVQ